MPGMASGDQPHQSPELAAVPQTLAIETALSRVRSPKTPATVAEELRTPMWDRHPATDYTTTRLVNFRIPVDLHDRYKKLVREIEEAHPRLRHPSLTELVIALLEEGPATSNQAAALIRRKRAAEHGVDP
jgi:hypothetical protein